MEKVIIVYASMSGNTEVMADLIAEGIKETGWEVELKDANFVRAEDLLLYDGILLGAYSYDGLPDEILDIYDELAFIDLKGKKAAAFGSGDKMYEVFGIAVDQLIEQLQNSGADVVLEGLKVELTPTGKDIERCKEFGREFINKLR